MLSKTVITCAAALVMIMCVGRGAAEATPITVDSVGDAFTVTLTGVGDPGSLPVSAEENWLVTAFGPTSVTFQVTLDNTSPTSPSRLTAFAFDTDPNAISGTSTSSIYQHVFLTGRGGGFDVCIENDNNSNCFGNRGNIGLTPSDPVDTFLLTLLFPDTSNGIVLSNFFARFQGIGPAGASAKIFGDPVCTSCDTGEITRVPEPTSSLLVGSAAVGFFLRRRRRTRRQT